jgi:hypothetical protein
MAAIPGKLRPLVNPVLFADDKNKLQVNLEIWLLVNVYYIPIYAQVSSVNMY